MSTLRIKLFGSLDLERDGLAPVRFPSRKVRDLFAYLALNRQTVHSREHLAALFWGDSDDEKARHSLNTALWRLNGVLTTNAGEQGRAQLRVTPQEIGFNASTDFWLDVAEFESRCALAERATSCEQQSALYSQAVRFYTGDLLTDCYEEWCIQERERLQCMYLRAQERLLSYHAERKNYEAAIESARRILAYDSLREQVHRELIELYMEAGQAASALRQYRLCEDLLERELAVAPMPETQALLARILGDRQRRTAREQLAIHTIGSADRTSTALAEIAHQLSLSVSLIQQAAAACSEVHTRLQELASMCQAQPQSEAAEAA